MTQSNSFAVRLRRAFAVTEFVAAGILMLSGVSALTTSPTERIGGDGIGTGIWILMAWPFLLSAVMVAISASTAWRGGRWWWAWQAALPVFWSAALVAMVIIDIAND